MLQKENHLSCSIYKNGERREPYIIPTMEDTKIILPLPGALRRGWANWLKRKADSKFGATRGWTGCTLSVRCGCKNETVDHLFVSCVFMRFVLGMSVGAIWFENTAVDARNVWEKLMTLVGPAARNKTLSYLSATWAVIWAIRYYLSSYTRGPSWCYSLDS